MTTAIPGWSIFASLIHNSLSYFQAARAPAPNRDATAINHICLEVESVDATAQHLRNIGVKLTAEPKLGLDGNRQAWFEDPDGNRIELMQMLPGNMQEAAIKRLSI